MGRKPIEMVRKTELLVAFSEIVRLNERIEFLEKQKAFSKEKLAERDNKVNRLFEYKEEYEEVIAVLGRESIRHANYVENSRHSAAMQEVAAMPLNSQQSINLYDNKEKVLAEEVPKKSASLRKPKQHKPKPKRRKQK